MKITRQYIYIAIDVALCVAWIVLTVADSVSESCYHQLMGDSISYNHFNKIQFCCFAIGNFLFYAFRKLLNTIQFIVLMLMLIIPVIFEWYIYACSQ